MGNEGRAPVPYAVAREATLSIYTALYYLYIYTGVSPGGVGSGMHVSEPSLHRSGKGIEILHPIFQIILLL